MAKLEWEESWCVGDDKLDNDHKVLVSTINRLIAAREDQEPTDWVLQDIADYANFHFTREEEMMKSSGYPGFDAHVKEHRMFIEWLDTVKTTFKVDVEARHYITDSVIEYLQKWLKEHILGTDMAYKGKI